MSEFLSSRRGGASSRARRRARIGPCADLFQTEIWPRRVRGGLAHSPGRPRSCSPAPRVNAVRVSPAPSPASGQHDRRIRRDGSCGELRWRERGFGRGTVVRGGLGRPPWYRARAPASSVHAVGAFFAPPPLRVPAKAPDSTQQQRRRAAFASARIWPRDGWCGGGLLDTTRRQLRGGALPCPPSLSLTLWFSLSGSPSLASLARSLFLSLSPLPPWLSLSLSLSRPGSRYLALPPARRAGSSPSRWLLAPPAGSPSRWLCDGGGRWRTPAHPRVLPAPALAALHCASTRRGWLARPTPPPFPPDAAQEPHLSRFPLPLSLPPSSLTAASRAAPPAFDYLSRDRRDRGGLGTGGCGHLRAVGARYIKPTTPLSPSLSSAHVSVPPLPPFPYSGLRCSAALDT